MENLKVLKQPGSRNSWRNLKKKKEEIIVGNPKVKIL